MPTRQDGVQNRDKVYFWLISFLPFFDPVTPTNNSLPFNRKGDSTRGFLPGERTIREDHLLTKPNNELSFCERKKNVEYILF